MHKGKTIKSNFAVKCLWTLSLIEIFETQQNENIMTTVANFINPYTYIKSFEWKWQNETSV